MNGVNARTGLACRRHAVALLLLIGAIAGADPSRADDFSYGRRLFLDKAQCSYCHGWAGDGAGEPQSNGGAANLRDSKLARDQLIEVIGCGVPGTPMPHFDDQAYTDKRCYGMTEAELGAQTPGAPFSTTLQRREIETLADYLLAKIIGRGPVTRAECEETFGPGARSCGELAK